MNKEWSNQKRVLEAYKRISRKHFLDDGESVTQNIDSNHSIGFGQTITQSKIIINILILCQLENRHKVLEIGTGSGYQTALLSFLVDKVYTIELIPELSVKAQSKLRNIGCENICFRIADGTKGWDEHHPYDRIIVSACCSMIPNSLLEQLAPNGMIFVPEGNRHQQILNKYTKNEKGEVVVQSCYPVEFVELVGSNGWHNHDSK